jgi:GAF domain-containing protein
LEIKPNEEKTVNNLIDQIQPPDPITAPVLPAAGPEYLFSHQRWLENFLKVILRVSIIFGFILVVAAFTTNTEPLLLIIYAIAFIALLIATFVRLPYRIRAGLFLFLLFSLGVSSLLENGIRGDSRTFFPVFIIMAAMLFGQRPAIYALILTVIAGAAVGIPLLTGHLSMIGSEANPGSWDAWIMAYLVNTLLALLVTTGLRMLQQEFDRAGKSASQYQELLKEERNGLDIRVQERTIELSTITEAMEKRAKQLSTIAEVAQQISSVQDINLLLPTITRLISEHLGYYHVGVFLLDKQREFAVLMAANSSGGQQMLRRGHHLKVGQVGIVGHVAAHAEPRISLDVGADAVFFDNPDLPDTRSEMALPLLIGEQIIGVLDVQSEKASAFSEHDMDVMLTLASQVAIAIENARLFSETSRALAEQQSVYGQTLQRAWSKSPLESKVAGYQYSNALVVPLSESLDRPEINSALTSGKLFVQNGDKPALAIPLKVHDQTIGILNISSNTQSRVWNENELALVQAVSERVALALENARLFEETTRRADRERTVSEITTRIRGTTDPGQILQTALDELKRALGANDIQIRPYSPPTATQNAQLSQPEQEKPAKTTEAV